MTMHFIATSGVLGGSTSSHTFSNIPQTFTALQIRMFGRFTGASSLQSFLIYPNSDGTADKTIHRMYSSGSGYATQGFGSQNFWTSSGIPAGNDLASTYGAAIVDILDYASTNKFKVMRALSGGDCNGSGEVHLMSGAWNSNTAISSLLIASGTGNFAAHSRIDLYGITSTSVTGA